MQGGGSLGRVAQGGGSLGRVAQGGGSLGRVAQGGGSPGGPLVGVAARASGGRDVYVVCEGGRAWDVQAAGRLEGGGGVAGGVKSGGMGAGGAAGVGIGGMGAGGEWELLQQLLRGSSLVSEGDASAAAAPAAPPAAAAAAAAGGAGSGGALQAQAMGLTQHTNQHAAAAVAASRSASAGGVFAASTSVALEAPARSSSGQGGGDLGKGVAEGVVPGAGVAGGGVSGIGVSHSPPTSSSHPSIPARNPPGCNLLPAVSSTPTACSPPANPLPPTPTTATTHHGTFHEPARPACKSQASPRTRAGPAASSRSLPASASAPAGGSRSSRARRAPPSALASRLAAVLNDIQSKPAPPAPPFASASASRLSPPAASACLSPSAYASAPPSDFVFASATAFPSLASSDASGARGTEEEQAAAQRGAAAGAAAGREVVLVGGRVRGMDSFDFSTASAVTGGAGSGGAAVFGSGGGGGGGGGSSFTVAQDVLQAMGAKPLLPGGATRFDDLQSLQPPGSRRRTSGLYGVGPVSLDNRDALSLNECGYSGSGSRVPWGAWEGGASGMSDQLIKGMGESAARGGTAAVAALSAAWWEARGQVGALEFPRPTAGPVSAEITGPDVSGKFRSVEKFARAQMVAMAEAAEVGDTGRFHSAFVQLKPLGKVRGNAVERLTHYVVEGLMRRMAGTGFQHFCTPLRRPPKELDEALTLYSSSQPFPLFGSISLAHLIAEAVSGSTHVHIVDFGCFQPIHLPVLMELLASRPGGPPSLRLTGMDTASFICAGRKDFKRLRAMEDVGRRLRGVARHLGVPFEFESVNVDEDNLQLLYQALVVVCFPLAHTAAAWMLSSLTLCCPPPSPVPQVKQRWNEALVVLFFPFAHTAAPTCPPLQRSPPPPPLFSPPPAGEAVVARGASDPGGGVLPGAAAAARLPQRPSPLRTQGQSTLTPSRAACGGRPTYMDPLTCVLLIPPLALPRPSFNPSFLSPPLAVPPTACSIPTSSLPILSATPNSHLPVVIPPSHRSPPHPSSSLPISPPPSPLSSPHFPVDP
ncbi:unnamed protein product [Closterium sp. Naga37s-1]|nr:unnamed protein product [Closterium sp. Naga37s-1]